MTGFICGAAVPALLLYALFRWALRRLGGGELAPSAHLGAGMFAAAACAIISGIGGMDGQPFPGDIETWTNGSLAYAGWAMAFATAGAIGERRRRAAFSRAESSRERR